MYFVANGISFRNQERKSGNVQFLDLTKTWILKLRRGNLLSPFVVSFCTLIQKRLKFLHRTERQQVESEVFV